MIQFSNNELKWYDKQDLVVAIGFKVNVGISFTGRRQMKHYTALNKMVDLI